MDTGAFLARVVAPGNYLAVGWESKPNPPKYPKGGFTNRFFPASERDAAVGLLHWCRWKGLDAYHAMASYVLATPSQDEQGRTVYKGRRTQDNAQRLKALWVDLDVTRPGDGKAPGVTFANQAAALSWIGGFVKAVGLPRPNMVVNSGYGVHGYWLLEDALTTAEWQPQADAFKRCLLANGYVGDASVVADAARVLRPPGTSNMKSGTAAPVTVFPALVAPDYPNAQVLAALQPYLVAQAQGQAQTQSAQSAQSGQGVAQGMTAALGGGSVSSIFAAHAQPKMGQAAQANIPTASRPRKIALIATECAQVGASLANNGATDPYPLWFTGNLTLAEFCVDGAQYVHAFGLGSPKYTQAGTDAAVALIAAERVKKGFGPPSCAHYNGARQGVCGSCPHFNQIKSPWNLGLDHGDLPDHYRRGIGGVEYSTETKDGTDWNLLLAGDVHSATLDELRSGYALSFTHERAGKTFPIYATSPELTPESAAIYKLFQDQHIMLTPSIELKWRGFLVAWIDKLRAARLERVEQAKPFGWAEDRDGKHMGFAVAGTLYLPDGGSEPTANADPVLCDAYRPRGNYAAWQDAAKFVTKGRPDLQALVACAFAAPLMGFTDHRGVIVSAWSSQSGVGKSSAMLVGQAVWCATRLMTALNDTNNATLERIGDLRTMPTYWDEMQVSGANIDRMVDMAFQLSQGKGKARLKSDTSYREVAEWETVLIAAANKPFMDAVVSETEGSEAGALRVFEFNISIPAGPDDLVAARTIGQARKNYGWAGIEYARWLAANKDRADQIVATYKAMVSRDLGADQSERLYVAGMATMLAGARLATHAKILAFDVDGLRQFLYTEFRRMRDERTKTIVATAQGYDLDQLFGNFMSDTQPQRVITSCLAKQGRAGVRFEIRWHPQGKQALVQVAQDEKLLRVERTAFYAWCTKHKHSGAQIAKAIQTQWGATSHRKVLGGGTPYGSGQVWVLDIALTRPELAGYLYADANAAVSPGATPGAAPASPGAALKGKAKVV